jgi:transposase
MSIITYDELRKQSPKFAREMVRRVLLSNGGNVSKTAYLLKTTRNTVRRARDGDLEDKSRRPKTSPKKTITSLENFIVQESKNTGFRYRRLAKHLFNQYGISISENTVKAILRRNNVKVKKKRSASGKNRHLYDYEALSPFCEFQLDTKHLLDKRALSERAYKHMGRYDLPKYEWNLIDIGTRARFTAYSYELSSTYGYMFIVFCVLWLRAHNVRNKIRIRMDNGGEFCGGSDKKLNMWNSSLSNLDVELYTIPPGAKHLMGVVENSHRADDEFFLIPHIERCLNLKTFLYKAQKWQDTWNFAKPNFGIAMNGMTPYQKLKASNSLIHHHILKMPTILMEHLFKFSFNLFNNPMLKSTGQYVYTKCLLSKNFCLFQ